MLLILNNNLWIHLIIKIKFKNMNIIVLFKPNKQSLSLLMIIMIKIIILLGLVIKKILLKYLIELIMIFIYKKITLLP